MASNHHDSPRAAALSAGLIVQNFYNRDSPDQQRQHVVAGNYVTNTESGVNIDNVSDNTVGGMTPGARNVFGDNASGVLIDGSVAGATGNQVQGDYIGTDGTRWLGAPFFYDSAVIGVFIECASDNVVGGTAAGLPGNVIRGESGGNRNHRLPNRTVVSTNLVQGNYIGLNAAGTAILTGLTTGNDVCGIGIGNGTGNTIGGSTPSARNVISGWGTSDVAVNFLRPLFTFGNVVEGNYVGTNAAGTAALEPLGFTASGVSAAVNTEILNNLISGANNGVSDSVNGCLIQGNSIGTVGSTTQPTDFIGVAAGTNDIIGGTTPGAGNTIAFTDGPSDHRSGRGSGDRRELDLLQRRPRCRSLRDGKCNRSELHLRKHRPGH